MKILHVINFFKPSWDGGGPTKVCYDISAELVKGGHDVTVYTTDGFKSKLNVETNRLVDVDGIKTYYFKSLSRYLSRNLVLPIPYYLVVIARRELTKFDVIHIHEYRTVSAIIIRHYAKKYKVPYILQGHGSVLPTFERQNLKKIYDALFGYSILKDASKLIALTNTQASQYIQMGVDKSKIEVVPNGVCVSEFSSLPRKGEFRQKYSINESQKIVLFLGRIHEIKGIDLLVSAFSECITNTNFNDTKLVIAGPDDRFLSQLEKQIEELGIENNVLLTGPIYGTDKLEAYTDADIYVLPSIYETFPMTVIEACACSTPVIITKNCGIEDIIHDKAGYVIEHDKNKLKTALFDFLDNEKMRKRYGEGGRELALTKLSFDQTMYKIEGIYREVSSTEESKALL